jgi:hypothetical protein
VNTSAITTADLWLFAVIGYLATVVVELPVLYFGLSPRHSVSRRLLFGWILTAFTYPVVVLVLPALFTLLQIHSRTAYLAVAETFAPLAEVLFFRFLVRQQLFRRLDRDALVIVAANLASFVLGEAFLSSWIASLIELLH